MKLFEKWESRDITNSLIELLLQIDTTSLTIILLLKNSEFLYKFGIISKRTPPKIGFYDILSIAKLDFFDALDAIDKLKKYEIITTDKGIFEITRRGNNIIHNMGIEEKAMKFVKEDLKKLRGQNDEQDTKNAKNKPKGKGIS